MKKLICCCIIIYFTVNVFSQDTIAKKNMVTISALSILGATLSLSYYRTYKSHSDIAVHVFLRPSLVRDTHTARNDIFKGGDPSIIIRDPFWYYNRLATEAGFLFHSDVFL